MQDYIYDLIRGLLGSYLPVLALAVIVWIRIELFRRAQRLEDMRRRDRQRRFKRTRKGNLT
jgi:hypothetical protein